MTTIITDLLPGVKGYWPELGDRVPVTRMTAQRAYYGKHVFIDTPMTLKGRGISFQKTYTADHFTTGANNPKVGWNSYLVTNRAFEALKQRYPIAMEILLD